MCPWLHSQCATAIAAICCHYLFAAAGVPLLLELVSEVGVSFRGCWSCGTGGVGHISAGWCAFGGKANSSPGLRSLGGGVKSERLCRRRGDRGVGAPTSAGSGGSNEAFSELRQLARALPKDQCYYTNMVRAACMHGM